MLWNVRNAKFNIFHVKTVLFISSEKTKWRQRETRINAKTVIEAETRFAFVETREASRVFAICGIAEGRAASAAIFHDVPGSHCALARASAVLSADASWMNLKGRGIAARGVSRNAARCTAACTHV